MEYYRYDELPADARDAAYESWKGYWTPRAQLGIGLSVDEDLSSLKAALESVNCKLSDWEVNLSGWGVNTCSVDIDSYFGYELSDYDAERREPAVDAVPAAKSDGQWIGEGFMERWNAECKPRLDALLGEYREALAAAGSDDEVSEAYDKQGGAVYETYLNLAREQADRCMGEIGDDVEYYWSREGFERDAEANEWLFEEDGTFVGRP